MAMKQAALKFYKPVAIRTASFTIFCIITIVLLSLLLVASQTHFETDDGLYNELSSRSINGSYTINNGTDNGPPSTAPPSSVFSNFSQWSISQYFSGAYLPTLLAVLYSTYWDIIFMRLKDMEPFFRLAQTRGAKAKESLLLEYTGGTLPVVLFQSLANCHLVIVFASLVSLILTMSVPFASEVLYIAVTGTCTNHGDGKQCRPHLAVRIGVARFEEVVVGLVFFLALWIALQERKSRVYSEPMSIAGLAVLLQEPELIRTLRKASRLGEWSHLEDLSDNKYGIGHTGKGGDQETRLITIHRQPPSDGIASQEKGNVAASHSIAQKTPQGSPSLKPDHPLVLYPSIILFILFLLAGLVLLIIYYRLVGAPSGFESFMDSQSMGVHFLMTSFGVLIKTYWTSVEGVCSLQLSSLSHSVAATNEIISAIRTREPYRLLAAGKATPEDTILVQSRSHALTALTINLLRRRFFLAYIALIAVLSEVLTVALAGVPFHSSQSHAGYVVSTWLSTAILLLMMITLLLVLVRRSGPVIPYRLDKLLPALIFLCVIRIYSRISAI